MRRRYCGLPAAKRRAALRVGTAIALLTSLALSCTANRMHRPVSLEQHPEYSLAFIELDDQGELWAPAQLERALAHLERLNRNEAGVALVLFVHGWNADASPREESGPKGTLYRFRRMLVRLTESIRHEVPDLEIPVMGIYLSWRGRVSSLPLLREASFYNRRGAAERIAGATATEAIYRILMELRENPASRSVLFGHSFGSLILERALAQAVVSALLAAPGKELVFPADLVVLLNPAGSASQTKQLVDILARNRVKTYRTDAEGNRFERPLLVSFTSETDIPTRRFFPLGMRVKAWNKKFRAYGSDYCSAIAHQRRLYTHTAGHLPALHSHDVTVAPARRRPQQTRPSDRMVPGFLGYEESYDPRTQQVAFSFDGADRRFTIRRRPRALNDTPYWIMRVPRGLIPNHSAVLTEDVFRLVEALLVLSATYEAGVATVVEREDGVRPVAIVPRSDGSALFLDRSRAVYGVGPDSAHPVFLSCLSEPLEPSNAIGFQVTGRLAHAVLATRQGHGSAARCATELREFEVGADGYRQLSRIRLAGSACYAAAAVDLLETRLILTLDTEIGSALLVADLTEEVPRPRELMALPGDRAPTAAYFEASRRRLYAAHGESGDLWEIDLAAAPPRTRSIARGLGWPMALAFSGAERRLYVIDARSQTLWALDCADRCGRPTPFLRSPALRNPTTLAVGADGKLWLGDLEEQTLTTIRPDGSIESTLRSLTGAGR